MKKADPYGVRHKLRRLGTQLEQPSNAEEELRMSGVTVRAANSDWPKQRIHFEDCCTITLDCRLVGKPVGLSDLRSQIEIQLAAKEWWELRQ